MRYRYVVLSMLLAMVGVMVDAMVPFGHGAAHVAAPVQDGEEDAPHVLRVYQVTDLMNLQMEFANPATQWPGTGLLNLHPEAAVGIGGMGGGAGVMGGMGGGMGGMFAIPNATQQGMGGMPGMGGGGAGGGNLDGGGMGMGGGFGMMNPTSDSGASLLILLENLMQHDMDYAADMSQVYGGMLFSRQTETVHAEIAEILDAIRSGMAQQSMIQVEWTALRVDTESAQKIYQTDDQRVLQKWIDDRAVAYGTLSGLNGQLVFSTSGEHRNLVIGVTPVVGSFQDGPMQARAGVGYQAKTAKPVLGWMAQVRPVIPSDPDKPGLIYAGISHVLPAEPRNSIPVVGNVDRGDLPAFQVVGTVKALPNTWAIVGGMASSPAADPADTSPKYVILVRWKR